MKARTETTNQIAIPWVPVPLQVAVCTPGRMIDLIKMKACTMKRATYLVSWMILVSYYLFCYLVYF